MKKYSIFLTLFFMPLLFLTRSFAAQFPTGTFICEDELDSIFRFEISAMDMGGRQLPYLVASMTSEGITKRSVEGIGIVKEEGGLKYIMMGGSIYSPYIQFKDNTFTRLSLDALCVARK